MTPRSTGGAYPETRPTALFPVTNPFLSSEKDFTIEWTPLNGKMTDIRITKGASRYGRIKCFRDWIYHRAPWLPSWVTGWTIIRLLASEKEVQP